MARFIQARLFWVATTTLAATRVVFLLANAVPGDPVLGQLGDMAALNPITVADWRHKYGLDLPLYRQYLIYSHRDLGVSIVSQRPVLDES